MRYAIGALVLVFAWYAVGPGKADGHPAGGHGAALKQPQAAVTPPPGRAGCPVSGARVSSGWGPRWGTFHDGTDLAAPLGTPIRAVLGGIVTHSDDDDPGGYGSYVEVTSASGVQVQYGHVSARLVQAGARVRAGQVIARVGHEGKSTGNHLHLRVRPHGGTGRGVNPTTWLRARGVRLPCT